MRSDQNHPSLEMASVLVSWVIQGLVTVPRRVGTEEYCTSNEGGGMIREGKGAGGWGRGTGANDFCGGTREYTGRLKSEIWETLPCGASQCCTHMDIVLQLRQGTVGNS